MSASLSRAVARRHAQLAFRRHASTAAESASAAKEQAQKTASKAQEGLSRVTSSAGNAASRVAGSVGSSLSSIGGRTGRLIGFVSSLVPPTIYYSKVGLELAKLVAKDQKMALPSTEAFTQAYRSAYKSIQSGQAGNVLSRVRNMGTAEMVGVGIVGAEILGFFTVGEMLGRFKIVGYRGGKDHDEEH